MDPNAPYRAKLLFEQIKASAEPFAFLKGMVGHETLAEEREFVDFKSGYSAREDGKDELRTSWAKWLSCFANSDGGVVIFGIDAPKGTAKKVVLVSDAEALLKQLKEWLPTSTEPPVLRVEIERYTESHISTAGFVVCLIPPSPWRPHQVRSGGQPGLFHIRVSDNCAPCNHSTLRALFQPQLVSRFEVRLRWYHWHQEPDYQGRKAFWIHCWLNNSGPATADDVVILFHVNPVLDKEITFDRQH